jgi:hypothetical protein
MSPWIYRLAKKGWLPVTEHMKKRVEVAKRGSERRRRSRDNRNIKRPTTPAATAAHASKRPSTTTLRTGGCLL